MVPRIHRRAAKRAFRLRGIDGKLVAGTRKRLRDMTVRSQGSELPDSALTRVVTRLSSLRVSAVKATLVVLAVRVGLELHLHSLGYITLSADSFGRVLSSAVWASDPRAISAGPWLPLYPYLLGSLLRVHWDLVAIQRPEYGGGEIWFDDELIRQDGRFLPADLAGLNEGL